MEASNPTVLDLIPIERIRALERTGGPPIVARVIGRFLETAPAGAAAIREAVAAGNADATRRAAHAMKSSAANLGATRLSRQSKEIEHLAEDGALDRILPLLKALEAELGAAMTALRGLLDEAR